ncbi:hypothetical protein BDV97DRAFT_228290 [Delphinella strobiligena]|nr:hypothetical protein BDV97DRAFT_228290 [Delphinella strobiligena]
MAHSHSQSQPMLYRYRPNAPTRAFTTVPPDSMKSESCQSPPVSSHTPPHHINGPSYDGIMGAPFMQPFIQANADTSSSTYAADSVSIDHTALTFANGLQPMEVHPQLSPRTSPWASSDSSVASDTCSATWSSPASSMSFSPEPQYQIPFMESAPWAPSYNPYVSGHCIAMQDVYPVPVPTLKSDYAVNPIHLPQMPQQWQYQFMNDSLFLAYESTEYSSSHGSPESTSQRASRSSETVTTIVPRSSSLMTEDSCSSPVHTSIKESAPPSPQPFANSQFQGQLLDFSTPVAQAKSKGSKSAALPCPLAVYGCTSSFISKNEWKRHINTQHLRLEAWLCDQCPKRDNKREFNRKDLFIQHLKRMHPSPCPAHSPKVQVAKSRPNRSGSKVDKTGRASKGEDLDPALLEAEQRCHIVLRQPPSDSACLFCSTNFSGRGSWEARIEHVAKHMEQYKKDGNEVPDPKHWRADRTLQQWLVSEGVISKVRQRWGVA